MATLIFTETNIYNEYHSLEIYTIHTTKGQSWLINVSKTVSQSKWLTDLRNGRPDVLGYTAADRSNLITQWCHGNQQTVDTARQSQPHRNAPYQQFTLTTTCTPFMTDRWLIFNTQLTMTIISGRTFLLALLWNEIYYNKAQLKIQSFWDTQALFCQNFIFNCTWCINFNPQRSMYLMS